MTDFPPPGAQPASEDPAQELRSRFPELIPVNGVPSLFTINGVGLTLYGRRETDGETGTYVKTQCAVLLFVPVLCLRAYRVLDAPGGGWFFVGRTPLSGLARGFNALVLAVIVALGLGIANEMRTSSPAYKAEQIVAEAQRLEQEQKPIAAVRAWCRLAKGPRQAEGRQSLQRLLDGPLRALPLSESGDALRLLFESPYSEQVLTPEGVAAWLGFVETKLTDDPRGALAHIDLLGKRASKAKAGLREQALRALVGKEPSDGKVVSQLALLLEESDRLKEAEPLLRAAGTEALKGTEGARILGQLLAAKGETEAAHALLLPYVEVHLKQVQQLEDRLVQSYQAAETAAFAALRAGKAGDGWYRRHKALPKPKQQEMVREWVTKRVRGDKRLLSMRQELQAANKVVPVALDLGIVKIQRARSLADPQARKAELEAAEKILLGVQRVAGASIAYKINLGKVRYQLGKADAGKAMFDEILTDQKRSTEALLLVARACREVGANADARSLSEEAWKAGDAKAKQMAASFRALLANDEDEEALWLGRSNTDDPAIAAGLSASRGKQALRRGETKKAVVHLRKAVALYGKLRANAATLNNVALVHQILFSLTGEAAELTAYTRNLAKAETLLPGHPILMSNAAAALLSQGVLETIGERLDLKLLRATPHSGLLPFLYDDAAGRKRLRTAFSENTHFRGAVERYKKLQVLTPKLPGHHISLFHLFGYTRDPGEHRALAATVQGADLDRSDQRTAAVARFAPPPDKDKRSFEKELERQTKALARARAGKHAPTLALSLCLWVETKLRATRFAPDSVDPDALLKLTAEAIRLSPSHGARSVELSVRLLRATRRLTQHPPFAEMRKRSRRSLSAPTLVAVALLRPELRDIVARDPDVLAVAKLIVSRVERLPDTASTWDGAIVSRVLPSAAETVLAAIRKDPVNALRVRLRTLLDPFDVEAVFMAVFEAHLSGKPEAAQPLLKAAKQRQLPLPYDPE